MTLQLREILLHEFDSRVENNLGWMAASGMCYFLHKRDFVLDTLKYLIDLTMEGKARQEIKMRKWVPTHP